jgi:hypothetical protein
MLDLRSVSRRGRSQRAIHSCVVTLTWRFRVRLSLRERIEVRAAGAKRTRNFRIAVAPMLRLNTSGKQTMRSTIPAIGHCVPQRSDL